MIARSLPCGNVVKLRSYMHMCKIQLLYLQKLSLTVATFCISRNANLKY